jgi:hypothetical protein
MINALKIFLPSPVFAASNWNTNCVTTDGVATIQGFECIFANILQIIVGAAGLVFLGMFIVGGFKYLTSGGDSKKTAAASSTLGLAVIGVVGVIASWLILKFISDFTGVNITQFSIPNGSNVSGGGVGGGGGSSW